MLEKRDVLEQQTPLGQKKLIVSHAPFYHSGRRVTERSYHIMLAALPALLLGFYHYGMPAFSVYSHYLGAAL
jgi:electron transport complex protein RnfD